MRRLLRTFAVRKLKEWEWIKVRIKFWSFHRPGLVSMRVSSKVLRICDGYDYLGWWSI